ncbi:phasin family protein [Leeia sp.]|uniref:phasin family protein n=1 Tax=Leeia sp. TaxID=2884678 RepID=UPI0035B0FE03
MQANEALKAFSLKQLESALQLAQISLQSTEQLIRLQLDVAKSTLESQAQKVQAATELKTPEQLAQYNKDSIKAGLESVLSYSNSLYELASQTQNELGKLGESQLTALNKDIISTLDQTAKHAPAGSETAVAVAKQTVQATAAAIDSLTKAAKQVADFAEASVKAAATATTDAVRQAARL